MKATFPCGIAALCLALGACSSARKEDVGLVAGAAGGAAIGKAIGGSGTSGLIGLVGGAVVGGMLGKSIGKNMDEKDREKARLATQSTLEGGRSGTTAYWRNPDTGHVGSITPYAPYKTGEGHLCRPYTETVTIDGDTQRMEGHACRRDDGVWVASGR